MKTFNLKREAIIWAIMLLPFIYTAFAWPNLPDRIPTHYGMSGQPDDWGGRISILLMPALSVASYLFMWLLPVIDPRKTNYTDFPNVFFKRRLLPVIYFSVVSISLIYGGVIHDWSFHTKLFSSAIFILLAFSANYLINIKSSWFIGIRNPWTLSSDTVWKQTHLIFGRILFYGSLLCFVISFFLHGREEVIMLMVFLLVTYALANVYSFWLYRKEAAAGKVNGSAS